MRKGSQKGISEEMICKGDRGLTVYSGKEIRDIDFKNGDGGNKG